jgi:hypothetical protein
MMRLITNRSLTECSIPQEMNEVIDNMPHFNHRKTKKSASILTLFVVLMCIIYVFRLSKVVHGTLLSRTCFILWLIVITFLILVFYCIM